MSELDSSVGSSGGFVCLVDGDGQYNLSEERLQELIKHVDPNNSQDYSIVGIMGCQSTGKSTLLNRLFNTQFAMMNSETGRSQTTKGIWLDAARNTNNLVVMDLEGTDSGERGEDRTTFERQTILYALALCEILIINMWETDIGRYTASNYGIMKTVFEVNLQLFKAQGKTMLLFIIRDYNEDGTPFHTLQSRLLREIQAIWDELRKPEEFKNSSMYDLFDFKFTYLPHFVYKRERFEELALQLKSKFIDPNHPDSYLATPYHGVKSVPAESFAKYSSSIWHTIKENQDLNLPTQREMLAAYRCDEVIRSLTDAAQKETLQIEDDLHNNHDKFIYARNDDEASPLAEEFIATYTKVANDITVIIKKSIEEFDSATDKYLPNVVSEKRVEFLAKLEEQAQVLIFKCLGDYYPLSLVSRFSRYLDAKNTAPSSPYPIPEFSDLLSRVADSFQKEITVIHSPFNSISTLLPKVDIAIYEKESREKLDEEVGSIKSTQFYALWNKQRNAAINAVLKEVKTLARTAGTELWPKLSNVVKDNITIAFKNMEPVFKAYPNNSQPDHLKSAAIKEIALSIYNHFLMMTIDEYITIMREYFEASFCVNGLPRVWKPNDDPHAVFAKAKKEGIDVFNHLRSFKRLKLTADLHTAFGLDRSQIPTEDDTKLPPSGQNFGSDDPFLVINQYELSIQPYLSSALVEIERARSHRGIPAWVFPLVIVLGYNEFMYILSNPFLLLFIVLFGVGAFVIHQLGLSGPVLTICKAIFDRVLEQVGEVLTVTNQESSSPSINPRRPSLAVVPPNATTKTPLPSPSNSTAAVFSDINLDQLPEDDDEPVQSPEAAFQQSVSDVSRHTLTNPDSEALLPRSSTTLDLGTRHRLKRFGTMTLRRDQSVSLQQLNQQNLQQQQQQRPE